MYIYIYIYIYILSQNLFILFDFLTYFIFLISDLLSSKSSLHIGQLSKKDISVPYPQSRNLVEINNEQTSNTRPLPPVPHFK